MPEIFGVDLATGKSTVLGLDSAGMMLLILTLVLSAVGFSLPRTTMLEGPLHLIIFLIYVVLIFSP